MTLSQFIQTYKLKAGDSIILKQLIYGLLDHYLVYLGIQNGQFKFLANHTTGTRILNQNELSAIFPYFGNDGIRRFIGNEVQRVAATNRALSRVDQNSYHLLINNCEHLGNYTKNNTNNGKEAAIVGTGLVIAGLTTAAASKDASVRGVGLFASALGLITLLIEDNKIK